MSALGMADIAVSILRWVSDDQPGIIEFSLVDSDGKEWRFIDKQPIASPEVLDAYSSFPRPGSIRCTILALDTDEAGRSLARIDTRIPWGVEAIDETHIFEVQADRLDRNVPPPRTIGVIETIIVTAEKKT